MHTYDLIEYYSDGQIGEFTSIPDALRFVRKAKVRYYALYRDDGIRVAYCHPHPDDDIPHEDSPSLDAPWWETER